MRAPAGRALLAALLAGLMASCGGGSSDTSTTTVPETLRTITAAIDKQFPLTEDEFGLKNFTIPGGGRCAVAIVHQATGNPQPPRPNSVYSPDGQASVVVIATPHTGTPKEKCFGAVARATGWVDASGAAITAPPEAGSKTTQTSSVTPLARCLHRAGGDIEKAQGCARRYAP